MRWTECVRALVVFVVALFLATTNLTAQTSNAQIVGDVIDPTGAAIPGASVIVTNQSTGLGRTVETNELGQYRVYPLNPATYEHKAATTPPGKGCERIGGFE